MSKSKQLRPLLLLPLLASVASQAQAQRTVSGRITDAQGNPLAGASVQVKGTTVGTTTNATGNYSLSIPANANTLVVSNIGYADQEISITGNTADVRLSASSGNLNDVVVVGYGTQRKRDVTGAIAKVAGENVSNVPTPSFEAALQGKAPGVQVIQGSGLAGSGSVVRIRGVASISAGGDPLYVIDGFPVTVDNFTRGNSGAMNQNPLAAINPNDIESVEVLKDAAAAGIYGSRGANGVILITTKRGRSGKLSVNYNNKLGIQTYANRPEFLNNQEWLQLRQEAWENDGNTGLAPLPGGVSWNDARNTNTDWWDLLTRTGVINEHNLGVTGGNKIIRNYLGLTFSDNNSYLENNSFRRYGATYNGDITPVKNLRIGVKSSFFIGDNRRVPAAWAGGLGDAMSTALPIYPVRRSDGTYFTAGANPVRRLEQTQWRNTDFRSINSLNIDYNFGGGLSARLNGNYETYRGRDDQWESAEWQQRTNIINGQAKRSLFGGHNYMANFTLNYQRDIRNRDRLNIVGGAEFQERVDKDLGFVQRDNIGPFWENQDMYNNVFDSVKNANAAAGSQFGGERYAETFISFFTRANYTLKGRYNFQASVRVDGSSKFGTNNKYGVFPTVSAGWTISEEAFMKEVKWVNFLKLRGSYGINGNSNIFTSAYVTTYTNQALYNGQATLRLRNLGNPDLKWEQISNYDFGLEGSFFNNRVKGEFSYFNKQTTDLLLEAGIGPSVGLDRQFRNVADSRVVNEGFELSLDVKVIQKKDLQLSIGGNALRLYNELKSLGTLSPDAAGGGTNDTRVAVGYPIGTNFLVRYYGVDPQDGLPIWYDKSGKLTKTFSLDNRVPVGSVIPEYVGGINHNLTYKGFEFSSLWTYTIGGNLYDGSGKRQAGVITDWNIRRDQLDRWRKPGDEARFPRLTMNPSTYNGLSSEWQYNSTLFLYDASFVRLRELTFAYRFAPSALTRLKIRSARVFVTGMNLLTFSKYPGGDPEIARDFENSQDRNLSPNITYLTPPQAKSVILGMNVTF